MTRQNQDSFLPSSKSRVWQACQLSKSHIKEDYFKAWSSNMAYVFGFWYAKGCVYGDGCFDITVGKKDKYIVKKIAQELGFNGKLCDGVNKQLSRINFSCQPIYDDLKALTSAPNWMSGIPEEFIPDFVRGYFDGRGKVDCIKGERINVAVSGDDPSFLYWLLRILKDKAGVKSGNCSLLASSFCLGHRDSLLFGKYIYGTNNTMLFLLRKRQKFPI